MGVSFTWLGHSAFALDIDGHPILIDPFLTGNPLGAASPDQLPAEVILLSHAHGDHVGDTIAIAKRTGAQVLCNFEMGNWLMAQGVNNVMQGNTGGSYDCGFMRVKWTIAHHSAALPDGSYGGNPNGFVITTQSGKRLYFAGDTGLFMDMQLIGDERIDVAFLPVGDLFTMGPEDSLKAIGYVRPRVVVPMHYNTFPGIAINVVEWANRVNSVTNAVPVVLDPGGTYTLP